VSARMRGGGDVDKRASAAGCARHSAISDQDKLVWAPGTYTEERREPEERGPLKGTRLHAAKWVGLRIVARHTDESFESSFRRVTSHVCLRTASPRVAVGVALV